MLKQHPLESENISRLILKFALPSIVSLLVNTAYNITDQIFIGNVVGMLGNAATNVAFPVVTLSLAFAQLVGVGTAANFNICMGAKQETEAKSFLGNGLLLAAFLSLFILLFGFLFKTPILLFNGATPDVLPLASEYFGITLFGLPFALFTTANANLIRADSSPAYSMFCTIFGAILNVFLDWLFMYPLALGIRGAALATVTGQVLSFFLSLAYLFRFKSFRISLSIFKLQLKRIGDIIKLGTANFINLIILMLVNILMNHILKNHGANTVYGSNIPLAISGVVSKLSNILLSISIGLSQGCQPILGYNMGAKNYARVKQTFWKALRISTSFCIPAFIAFQLFPDPIIRIFGEGSELYFAFGRSYLRIFMFMIFSYGIQPLAINYFTATGNVRSGVFLSLAKQGLILIPLLLLFSGLFGLQGVLYAGPIADFLSSALSLYLVWRNFKQLT